MSPIVSLKEMQEKQFLHTTGERALPSTRLSALFKYPVVTKPQQHTAHPRIPQPPAAAFFLRALRVCQKCPQGLLHFRVARRKKEKKNNNPLGWGGGAVFSPQIFFACKALMSY